MHNPPYQDTVHAKQCDTVETISKHALESRKHVSMATENLRDMDNALALQLCEPDRVADSPAVMPKDAETPTKLGIVAETPIVEVILDDFVTVLLVVMLSVEVHSMQTSSYPVSGSGLPPTQSKGLPPPPQ